MFNWLRKLTRPSSELSPETLDWLTTNAGTYSWRQLFGNFHPRDLRGNVRNQLGLSAIYCAVNLYEGAICSLPRICQKIDPVTRVPSRIVSTTEHPASKIWSHRAAPDMSSTDMIKRMIFDILYADGNFYALPLRNRQGQVFQIQYVHPSRIPRGNIELSDGETELASGRKAPRGTLVYKVLKGNKLEPGPQETLNLSADQIIHMKGLIPDTENNRSIGVLELNTRSAGLYDAAEAMGAHFYERGYTNQMFLSTDEKLSPKVRQDLEALMNNEKTSGLPVEEIFKSRILSHGLKPVHMGLPLQQIQFIETRAFSVEDVARWFMIPPGLLQSVMGVGTKQEDYEKQMTLWIQNGLGSFLNNLATEFRENFIAIPSQPLFQFDFQRLHLYKTVLNDFSQALRNLFETGAINRLDMASLLGIHLDPSDQTNKQRYVPSNLITVGHSLSLEKKTSESIKLLEEQIMSATQTREHGEESFQAMKDNGMLGAPPVAPGQPGEKSGDDDDDPGKAKEEGKQDKKTRPATKRTAENSDDLVWQALYNVLYGLHLFELRVLGQKKKSRSNDLQEAMNEWYPRFQESLRNSLEPWADHLSVAGYNLEHLISTWPGMSRLAFAQEGEPSDFLKETFNSNFGFLNSKGDTYEPGSESEESGSGQEPESGSEC